MIPSKTRAGGAAGSWVAFLLRHCLAGMLAGWTAVGALLWSNPAGVGELVLSSDLFPLPLLMLLAFFGITFGSIALGGAIMALGRSSDAGDVARGALAPTAARRTARRF